MIFDAIQAVLMILIIMAIGYFVSYKGWAGKSVTDFVSKLVVNVAFPCTVVTSFLNNFTPETLGDSWLYIVTSFVAIGVAYAICKLVIKFAKIDKTRRGVFTALFAFSNSVFVGLPVAMAIFGEDAIVFALFYYIANTTFMNGVGFVEIARDGMEIKCLADGGIAGKQRCFSGWQLVKKVFQPPLIAVFVGFALVLLRVQLPTFLFSAVTYAGNLTSPLALIFVGMILQRTGLSCIKKLDKNISWALVGRFVISPAVMFAVATLLNVPSFPKEVLTVQMGLPAMVTATIFAEISGADTEFAAKGVVVTTLLSFLTIPIYVLLF